MPSNKDKVASYLEDSEIQALDKFCKEKDCSRSQGVAYLIKEKLMHDEEIPIALTYSSEIEKRLKILEGWRIDYEARGTNNFNSIERHDWRIAELQEDVCRLKAEIKEIPPQYFTDDEIASVTGRRLQEVYEWRLGIRKPRGCRVLEKLKPFEIVDGQWRKKKVSEHLKSVQQSVQHF